MSRNILNSWLTIRYCYTASFSIKKMPTLLLIYSLIWAEQVDLENLIVTLLMTSFFVIKNQLQHFTKLTALEIKLEIMVLDVCSKVKILVMRDV